MRRSFIIIALLLAAILGNLALEIATPSLAMAGGPEPFELPQWTAKEMTVESGTCQVQYDGYIVETDFPFHDYNTNKRNSFVLGHDTKEAGTLRATLCNQYTRDKGWEIPDGCVSVDYGNGQGYVLQRHYYCYCMRDAVIECVGAYGKDDHALSTLLSSSSRRIPSSTSKTSPTQRAPSTAQEVADAFAKAIELVREISRALRDDPYQAPRRPSGTRYVSSSSRADELYDQGMAAYEKPSHTDEETITALSSFGACIEEDPYHTPCIWQLGWVFWANGDYNLTDILWRRVKQIDPNHASVDEWLDKLQRKL